MFLFSFDKLNENRTKFGDSVNYDDSVIRNTVLPQILNDNFSATEIDNIMESNKADAADSYHKLGIYANSSAREILVKNPAVDNDKLFLLSAEELYTGKYGFATYDTANRPQRSRGTEARTGYLATRSYSYGQPMHIENYGLPDAQSAQFGGYNVRPGMNIAHDNILFINSAIESYQGTVGENSVKPVENATGNEYVLTIRDIDQDIMVDNVIKEDNKISFDYNATGGHYLAIAIKNDNGDILYYGKIKDISNDNIGTATFILPEIVTKNSNNYTINAFTLIDYGSKLTKYASELAELKPMIQKPEIINHAPTINATDKVLTVGDTFNPLDGVTAFDDEDGDITLTEANIIANNVDMNKAGTYSVTYKITDSKGAATVKTITVTVNEKTVISEEKTDDMSSNPMDSSDTDSSASTQNTSKLDGPKTGDATNLGLLTLMVAGSSGILFGLIHRKRRNQKK